MASRFAGAPDLTTAAACATAAIRAAAAACEAAAARAAAAITCAAATARKAVAARAGPVKGLLYYSHAAEHPVCAVDK